MFRLCFVTIDVDNTQEAHTWLTSYLSHLNVEGRVTTWGTMTLLNDLTSTKIQRGYRDQKEVVSAKAKSNIFFVPGTGIHIVRVSYLRWIFVHKTVAEVARQDMATKEVLWLGTLGTDESFFRDFIDQAREHSFKHDRDSTVVYVQDGYRTQWKKALSKSKRSWESVILDGTVADEVYAECRSFLDSKDWYMELGVPYRRSFLLESAPGCGKSSFIQALAGRLNFDICFLSLAGDDLSDAESDGTLSCT